MSYEPLVGYRVDHRGACRHPPASVLAALCKSLMPAKPRAGLGAFQSARHVSGPTRAHGSSRVVAPVPLLWPTSRLRSGMA